MIKYLWAIFLGLLCANCTKVVDGYTDKISYFPDETIEVYLNGTADKKAIALSG
jgi:hypothetical protein